MRDSENHRDRANRSRDRPLVLQLFHTLDATETITRIVSSFPAHQQKSVRLSWLVFQGRNSMRWSVAAKGPGRVPAIEVLVQPG